MALSPEEEQISRSHFAGLLNRCVLAFNANYILNMIIYIFLVKQIFLLICYFVHTIHQDTAPTR